VSGETAHEAAVVATTVGVPAGSAVWNVVGGEELLRAAASDSLTAAIQEPGVGAGCRGRPGDWPYYH
jgi:hypothetical protein